MSAKATSQIINEVSPTPLYTTQQSCSLPPDKSDRAVVTDEAPPDEFPARQQEETLDHRDLDVGQQSQAPVVENNNKFSNHLLTYPLIHDLHESVMSVPLLKRMHEATKPAKSAIRSTQPIKTIGDFTDKELDAFLNIVDSHFPSLTSLEFQDVHRPVTQPLGALHLAFMKSIVEPSARTANSMSTKLHSLSHDKNGSIVGVSLADPIISPMNHFLEDHVVPGDDKVPDQSSELKRCFMILGKPFETRKEKSTRNPSDEAHEVDGHDSGEQQNVPHENALQSGAEQSANQAVAAGANKEESQLGHGK